SSADLLRPRLERLDPDAGIVSPGRPRAQRGARGRDDRDGEADGRARDGAGLPPAPGIRARATPAQPHRDRDRRRRADLAQPRRDPPAARAALGGRARAPAGAAVDAQRGRRAAAPAALARARQQSAQQGQTLPPRPLALADRLADELAPTVDEKDGGRVSDLIALLHFL